MKVSSMLTRNELTRESTELLEAVHAEHSAPLFWYALRLTHEYGAAQDIVQESFLKLWKNKALLEQGSTSVRKWLFTVARNLVIDDRRTSRYSREITVDAVPEVASVDHTDSILDAWLISDALASLTEKHRSAIVKVFYLGHPLAEVARQEGTAEGTIKSRLHYALIALRNYLNERGISR